MPNLGFSGLASPNANFGFQTNVGLSPNEAVQQGFTALSPPAPDLGAIANVDAMGNPLGFSNISQEDFNAQQTAIDAENPFADPNSPEAFFGVDPHMTVTPPLNTFMPDRNVITQPPTPVPQPIAFVTPVETPPQKTPEMMIEDKPITIPVVPTPPFSFPPDKDKQMEITPDMQQAPITVNPYGLPNMQTTPPTIMQNINLTDPVNDLAPPEGYEQAFAAPMSMSEALDATLNAMNPTMTAPAEESDTSDTSGDEGGNEGGGSGEGPGSTGGEGGEGGDA